MAMVSNIRQQLKELCKRNGVPLTSAGSEYSEPVRKALLRGLFVNVAEHIGRGEYQTVRVLVATKCLCPPLITWRSKFVVKNLKGQLSLFYISWFIFVSLS